MRIILVYLLISILIYRIPLINNINVILISYSSNITIKINKAGRNKIYNNDPRPLTAVYINGVKQENKNNQYDLTSENNIIKLVWDEPISTCNFMFSDCSNITEIDFSEFNSSYIIDMIYMFQGCSSLTSINFENFDTSKVTQMRSLFGGCVSLTSLNLSNFKTPQVNWISNLFENCISLTSIDLSSFDTSNVFYMDNMFNSCSRLEYVNIQNFIANYDFDVYYREMFIGTPNNMVICVNESKAKKIIEQINLKNYTIIDCSEDWQKKRKKRIENAPEYVDNCKSIRKYEQNGICMNQCSNVNYKIIETNEENFCGKVCPRDTPFLLPYKQKCIKNCDINDINKKCFLTYINEDSDDLMLYHIQNNLKINTIIGQNNDIIIEELDTKFIISKYNIATSGQNFENCKKSFDIYYSDILIKNEFYILTINTLNNTKKVYEIYYSLDNDEFLIKLDLDKIDDNCYFKTELSRCLNFSVKSIIEEKCISCKNGYYPIFIYEEDSFVKCLRYPFNINYSYLIRNECYKYNMKFIPNNISCVNDCRMDKKYRYEFNHVCYEECPSNTKPSKNNEFYCEILCPEDLPYEIIETQLCVSYCSISDMLENICRINFKSGNEKKKTNLGIKIVEEILNGNLADLLEQVLQNKSFIINENNSTHHITSLNNQNDNNNLSSIYFGDCEEKLKGIYNIRNEEIIIYKIEHKIEGFNIPK